MARKTKTAGAKKVDPFLAHEAMDRASVAADYFAEHVEAHAFVHDINELAIAAENVTLALLGFYQLVARHQPKR